jgi:hypothetical protein
MLQPVVIKALVKNRLFSQRMRQIIESISMKRPAWANFYCQVCLGNNRWPEAESLIASDSVASWFYCHIILKMNITRPLDPRCIMWRRQHGWKGEE